MCVPRKVDKEKVDQATQIIESCWDETTQKMVIEHSMND